MHLNLLKLVIRILKPGTHPLLRELLAAPWPLGRGNRQSASSLLQFFSWADCFLHSERKLLNATSRQWKVVLTSPSSANNAAAGLSGFLVLVPGAVGRTC